MKTRKSVLKKAATKKTTKPAMPKVENPSGEVIEMPLSLYNTVMRAYEKMKAEEKAKAEREAKEGPEPDITGAVDSLGRVNHKLKCFSALFGGDEAIMEQIDISGAAWILEDITSEIEAVENQLRPEQIKRGRKVVSHEAA